MSKVNNQPLNSLTGIWSGGLPEATVVATGYWAEAWRLLLSWDNVTLEFSQPQALKRDRPA